MDKYTYLTLFSLSTLLFLTTPIENYIDIGWYYKSIFIKEYGLTNSSMYEVIFDNNTIIDFNSSKSP